MWGVRQTRGCYCSRIDQEGVRLSRYCSNLIKLIVICSIVHGPQ